MGIYSKTGDAGLTSNLSGEKLPKNDISIHFLGSADELNSFLGLAKTSLADENSRRFMEDIQKNIMKLMSHVSDAANGKYFFSAEDAAILEREIDRLSEKINDRPELVIPGKNVTEAQIHIARTAARKTERLFFAVNEKRPLCPNAGAYLNRLSDYLFVLSRQEF